MSLLTHERETFFVSFCTPHACVTVQTLTRWILSLLEEAGVDTSKWKSHAVRSASALHHRRNLSVLQIQKLADWSATGGVFRTFYEKYLWSPSLLCNMHIIWCLSSLTVVIKSLSCFVNKLIENTTVFLQDPSFMYLFTSDQMWGKEMSLARHFPVAWSASLQGSAKSDHQAWLWSTCATVQCGLWKSIYFLINQTHYSIIWNIMGCLL